MKNYRIVTDNYRGFEVQRRFLFVFWIQCCSGNYSVNTFYTIEECETFIQSLVDGTNKIKNKSKVVKNIQMR